MNVVALFSHMVDVVEFLSWKVKLLGKKASSKAYSSFHEDIWFCFSMHLMIEVLGITNDLSLTLQKKDQNIANAVRLVKVSKRQ